MNIAHIAFDRFNELQDKACHDRIRAARAKLGNKAVLLCHHYQRADVYQYADLTGDSLKPCPPGHPLQFTGVDAVT